MREHGGRLLAAARAEGIPPERWLDLSTGIAPAGYPVPPISPAHWLRLPEPEDGLLDTAFRYFGTRALLPIAGSQAAIGMLPWLRPPSRVVCVAGSYTEHAAAWRRAGHEVRECPWPKLDRQVDRTDVVVVVNPDNPTGRRLPAARLLRWRAALAARRGWLVVDEAFADAVPEVGVVDQAGEPGLVVLRSLGKFFGLAGARVGFLGGWAGLRLAMEQVQGPWPLAGPARLAAKAALADDDWQAGQHRALGLATERLDTLLARHGLSAEGGTPLFRYVPTPRARALQQALARRAVLVRRFDGPPALRLGLPSAGERHWQHLAEALCGALKETES